MTGSGQARGAGAMLRRLVMRFLLLAGFTAAGWLASVLLTAGTASADIQLPRIPGLTSESSQGQQPVRKPAKPAKQESGSGQGLLGGLLGGVTQTLSNTVTNVTTTVTQTVTTVTTTVTQTVGNVTGTVTTVIDKVTELPSKALPPPNGGGSLLPPPVTDLLKPGKPSSHRGNEDTSSADRAATEVVAAQSAAPSVAPVQDPATHPIVTPGAERPRVQHEAARKTPVAHPVRAGTTNEKAAPADKTPGPLPSPSAPVAPAAPAPTASASGNSGSDGRGVLAVLTPQTSLVPPRAGWLHRELTLTQAGRCAGLPATPPD